MPGLAEPTSRVRESLARIRTAGPDLLTAHWGGGVKDLEGVLPTLVDAGAFSKPSVISHGNRMVDASSPRWCVAASGWPAPRTPRWA